MAAPDMAAPPDPAPPSEPTPDAHDPAPTPAAPAAPPPAAPSQSASLSTLAAPPASTAGKADLGKRLVAAIIDGVIVGVLGVVPVIGGLVGAAYMLVRDGMELDFMDRRSIGKKVMKLRPVRLDGQAMDLSASARRNLPFAIGPAIMIIPILGWVLGPIVALVIGLIEVVLVLTDAEGRRLGDKWADTKVVEVAD
ncbi:MAG: RDD family protein [Rhodothermales bacterium]|nr:RDD family protein [Rhodothermales bacterium]